MTSRSGPVIVPTIARLRQLQPPGDVATVVVKGYRKLNDGGGGDFYWDSMSDEPDDGGTIFRVRGVALGRWKRLSEGNDGVCLLNLAWFGATGTGSSEDEQALTNATRAAVRLSAVRATALFFPQGLYLAARLRAPDERHVV
ncbi:MAG: hypothetical protein SF187_29100 [Deltaproteobacteria bacterium]|nr:hypothetical protein [Deltaproteobacteria bacterium]